MEIQKNIGFCLILISVFGSTYLLFKKKEFTIKRIITCTSIFIIGGFIFAFADRIETVEFFKSIKIKLFDKQTQTGTKVNNTSNSDHKETQKMIGNLLYNCTIVYTMSREKNDPIFFLNKCFANDYDAKIANDYAFQSESPQEIELKLLSLKGITETKAEGIVSFTTSYLGQRKKQNDAELIFGKTQGVWKITKGNPFVQ